MKNNNNRTIAIVAGIIIGLIVICCVGAFVIFGLGGAWLASSSEDPTNIIANVSAPTEVTQGDTFFITVEIENTASQAQTLDSVDIELTYLEGVIINSASPPFSESYDLFIWQSYTFLEPLPAGSPTTIQLEATALHTGDYTGEVDICINEAGNCLTYAIRTLINP